MKFQFVPKTLLLIAFSFIMINSTNPTIDYKKPSTKVYKGYVVTTSGNTIHGKIQMLSPTMNQVKVKFIDSKDKKKTYKAKEIQSYAFQAQVWDKKQKKNIQKWIFYTKKTVNRSPIPFAGTNVLIQQEVKGTVNVYNYYIETRTSQSMEHLIYLEKEGVMYEVDKENYRKTLKALFSDSPIIYHKIGTKGYTYKYLNQMIIEYNQEISKKGEATISYDITED